MFWKDNQGNIYGPYTAQEDGFPNAGEVVRFYREQKKLSQRTLAKALGVSRLWIMKMEKENAFTTMKDNINFPATVLQG